MEQIYDKLIHEIDEWRTVPVGWSGRADLDRTDVFWQQVFEIRPALRYPEGKLLFRIHCGGDEEPEFDDYSDWQAYGAASQQERFDEAHEEWENKKDPTKIRFDNHWVSFTKDPKFFFDGYYASKGLRGLVIVLRAGKAVDISSFESWGNVQGEQEVIAPLDKAQVVEILPFNEFKQKYDAHGYES